MSNSTSRYSGRERRRYFRIDDEIHLTCRRLESEEYEQLCQQPAVGGLTGSLVGELRALSIQAGNLMVAIRKRDPEVAQYLGLLDRKIDLLARLGESERLGDALKPNRRVNLSAGGIGFEERGEGLEQGAPVELRLVLFPSLLTVHALGRVMHRTERAGNAHYVGIEFTRISDAEQEGLVRHIMELQATELRRRRELEQPGPR